MNKVGKLILCMLAGTLVVQGARISLHVRPMRGTEIIVGTPFYVELKLEGEAKLSAEPQIQGFDRLQKLDQRSSTQITVMNGVQQQQQSRVYTMLASEAGAYTVGPAQVTTSAGPLEAAAVTFTVAAEEKMATPSNAGTSSRVSRLAAPQLSWMVPQKKIFVGERVPYRIRCVYTDQAMHGFGLSAVQIPGCRVTPHDGVVQSKDGDAFIVEWTGTFVPQQPGTLTLPALPFVYHVSAPEDENSGSLFSMMNRFMGLGSERLIKHVKSEPLIVHPLPPTNLSVAGVGVLIRCEATIDSTTVAVGESLTYRLELEGSFDADAIKLPELAVPVGTKVYPSKKNSQKIARDQDTLVAEYLIHCLTPGSVTIGPQQITFFDSIAERYITKTTAPQQITVTGTVAQQPAVVSPTVATKEQNMQAPADQTIVVSDDAAPYTSVPLGVGWFIVLVVCAPVLRLFVYPLVRRWWRYSRERRRLVATVAQACQQQNWSAAVAALDQFSQRQFHVPVRELFVSDSRVQMTWSSIDAVLYGAQRASVVRELHFLIKCVIRLALRKVFIWW